MLSKKSAIGIGIGCFLIAWGTFFLVGSIGTQSTAINETIGVGQKLDPPYEFTAQKNFHQILTVTGDSFHIKIMTSDNSFQIDKTFQNETNLDWTGLEEAQHRIEIVNTGNSDVLVSGTLEFTSNPLEFAKHMLPIISGIIIIGISAVFTVRKPRGF